MKTDFYQLNYLHIDLRKLLKWLENETGLEFTETSSWRPDDPNSVHGQNPCRGYDLRMRNYAIGVAIVNFINDHWTYDPERPELKCALIHGEGADMHIHLQVHPQTETVF